MSTTTRTPRAKAWGIEIKTRRIQMGMTQAALARRLGVTQVAISRWEAGLSAPASHIQDGLLRELGIDPSALHRIISEPAA